jgi:hypothetical protein
MTTSFFHPATVQLLRLQSRGRRRRMWARFCQPRRLILSTIAGALALVWLGNAALTVWLREAASPETLGALLSLSLVFYAVWHFAKAAFFRPEIPFEWTPAERELLAAMPLGSRDLVAYQLASVTATTFLKAGLFTLLLLPDLRCVPLGLVGLLVAMMMLEMLRMAIDIATWGMGQVGFLVYRASVVAGLLTGGFVAGTIIVREGAFRGQIGVEEGVRQKILDTMIRLDNSAFGYTAWPFRPVVDLVLADGMTAGNLALAAAALATVVGLAAAVIALYSSTARRVAQREKATYIAVTAGAGRPFAGTARKESEPNPTREPGLQLRNIPHLGGAGPLAWRQLVGAGRHWGSLLTAMIAPAVLACVPIFVVADPHLALLATTGTLAFYTFLLLPTALRFDFRRDLDRLATLKGLPVTPAAAATGQTLAPVLIATLFQGYVLALAIIARGLPPHLWITAMLVMIPLNVLVFGLDNLIYLLYPYRVQQEGLEIFLRTMLTFTAKGLLFAGGMAAVSTWGFAATALARAIEGWTGAAVNTFAVFAAGMVVGPAMVAALVLRGLARIYRNMNPIEDVPR